MGCCFRLLAKVLPTINAYAQESMINMLRKKGKRIFEVVDDMDDYMLSNVPTGVIRILVIID